MTGALEQIKRPVLRYHGGKWKLAPRIIQHFPPHRVYVEPFGGGASVLMRKPRSYGEVYNDQWGDVVNVFRVLRDPDAAAKLQHLLELTPFARDEFVGAYANTGDPIEDARRTILRSFAGFGSGSVNSQHPTGFRANSNRSGTTPAHDWVNYPRYVASFTQRLKGVTIENRLAVAVIAQHDSPETLFYVDPPYPHATRNLRRGNAVYAVEMDDAEHRALAEVLHAAQGMVVLSSYPSELYDELFKGWLNVERPHRADGGRARTEVLWLNAVACRALRGQTLMF